MTVLLNYHIGRFVLGSLCVGDLVRLVLSGYTLLLQEIPREYTNKIFIIIHFGTRSQCVTKCVFSVPFLFITSHLVSRNPRPRDTRARMSLHIP